MKYWLSKIFVMVILLSSCVTASRFNELRPGMERAEVVKILGTPDSTGFIDGFEYLYYRIPQSGFEAYASRGMARRDYVVRLRDGRVDSYGRAQDVVPVKLGTGQ